MVCDIYLSSSPTGIDEQTPPAAEKPERRQASVTGGQYFTVAFGYDSPSWYEGNAADQYPLYGASMYWDAILDVVDFLAGSDNPYILLPDNSLGGPYNNPDGTAF